MMARVKLMAIRAFKNIHVNFCTFHNVYSLLPLYVCFQAKVHIFFVDILLLLINNSYFCIVFDRM